jgi:16S rRNA (cytidine1402-2'-O)-methyltransferase
VGTLYVVATPIGNLGDVSRRALEILEKVDFVACEDTRRTLKLLTACDRRKPLISCRAENEARVAESIDRRLESGDSGAYVTDAGTPGISDPGAALVRTLRRSGHTIVPIPGPSALAAILSVSSFGDKTVTFEGFLSTKAGRRRSRLAELLEREEGFVIYESPYRIVKLLADIADLFPDRGVLIGREVTKLHEEFREGTASALKEELERRTRIIGEFTVLVSGRKMP